MVVTATAGLCEDDDELRRALRRTLEADGFEVTATATGSDAVRRFAASPPDVLVLDIGLPDADGRDVCQALRAHGVSCPVLFLSARDALPDRLSGFHAGGDDYLTKPFAAQELLVRLRSLIRRSPVPAETLTIDGVALDPATHAVIVHGQRVPLTPTEFRLLGALVAHPGEVLRRRELVAVAWPDGAIVHDNTLDAYIARIRRKLRRGGRAGSIETVRGVGYCLR